MNPERHAQVVLADLGSDTLPVDVYQIARRHNVRVEKSDLGADCSGILVRSAEGAVIGVHYAHHPNRQRFSVAHELGHFILHEGGTYVDRGTFVRFRHTISGSASDSEEREANQFAAALLMPSDLVRQEFDEHPFDPADDEALTAMAACFGVSIQALSYRLMNLGLVTSTLDVPSARPRKRSKRAS